MRLERTLVLNLDEIVIDATQFEQVKLVLIAHEDGVLIKFI